MKTRLAPLFLFLAGCALAIPSMSHAVPVEAIQLGPGVSLLVSTQRQIPMVFMVFVFRGGTLAEPDGKGGVGEVTAELVQRGTKAHPGEQLATALDSIGARMSINVDSDKVTLSLSALTTRLDTALDLLDEVLAAPAYAPEDFQKARSEAQAGLKAAEEKPSFVARRAILRALYGDHPYGRPTAGSEASLATLTLEDCVAYWKAIAVPRGATIAAAGDISGGNLAKRLRKHLSAWLALPGVSFQAVPGLPPPEPGRKLIPVERPLTQTTLLLGQRGIARTDPSYYALQVFNYSLGGGGFSSRLLDEIRDNRGLAYSVTSSFDARLLAGPFEIRLKTKNATAGEALSLVRKEVEASLRKGITEAEIEAAKAYLIGTYPRRYDTNAKMAGFLAATAFYGLGTDYDRVYPEKIAALTRERIMGEARRLLHPEQFITVAVGRLSEGDIKGK